MSNINDKVVKAFGKVLEDIAFMFTEPTVDEDLVVDDDVPYLRVSMRFSGSVSGTLRISTPKSMALELASNILGSGEGEPITDEMAVDALKELLNVTCGQIVTTLVGQEVIIELTIPEVDETAYGAFKADVGGECVDVQVDDYVVFLTLALER